MQLQFTNQQIFFVTSQCFGQLHFRLQTHLQDLVLTNANPETVQTVTITPAQLAQVYRSASTIAEGVARKINGEMKEVLVPQLFQLAGLTFSLDENNKPDDIANYNAIMALAQTGVQDNEGLNAILLLSKIDVENDATTTSKIESGKQQILA